MKKAKKRPQRRQKKSREEDMARVLDQFKDVYVIQPDGTEIVSPGPDLYTGAVVE
jgi:hypothetical protein